MYVIDKVAIPKYSWHPHLFCHFSFLPLSLFVWHALLLRAHCEPRPQESNKELVNCKARNLQQKEGTQLHAREGSHSSLIIATIHKSRTYVASLYLPFIFIWRYHDIIANGWEVQSHYASGQYIHHGASRLRQGALLAMHTTPLIAHSTTEQVYFRVYWKRGRKCLLAAVCPVLLTRGGIPRKRPYSTVAVNIWSVFTEESPTFCYILQSSCMHNVYTRSA